MGEVAPLNAAPRPGAQADFSHLSDAELEALIDPERIPRHIAIVMDGNGRWAQGRGLPRIEGHRAALDSVWDVVHECGVLHVEVLTLYAFSTENWKRPASEVRALMRLLREQIRRQTPNFQRHNVRVQAIGDIAGLPLSVRWELRRACRKLARNTGLVLNLALNYGGRQELLRATRVLAAEVQKGTLHPEEITEDRLAAALYTEGMPDPDLMIRTSGEMRLSNFLLWQSAYAELYFTPVLWPDFRRRNLHEAIFSYQQRERRFGGLGKTDSTS